MTPEALDKAMRTAARIWVRDRSWRQASVASGVPTGTLRDWNALTTQTPKALRWKEIVGEIEAELAGQPVHGKLVTTEGFKTPESFCDHWSLEAAKVQVETMVDPEAGRRDRLDASRFVAALGGHTPVSKAVVIAAPIDDRLAAQILGAIAQTQLADNEAQARLVDYTSDPQPQQTQETPS